MNREKKCNGDNYQNLNHPLLLTMEHRLDNISMLAIIIAEGIH